MDPELNWTRACVDRLDGGARATRWHLDQIAEQRAGVAPLWNDACALGLAQRYLDPLTDEAAHSLANVAEAIRNLRACSDAVQHVHELFDTVSSVPACRGTRTAFAGPLTRDEHVTRCGT